MQYMDNIPLSQHFYKKSYIVGQRFICHFFRVLTFNASNHCNKNEVVKDAYYKNVLIYF